VAAALDCKSESLGWVGHGPSRMGGAIERESDAYVDCVASYEAWSFLASFKPSIEKSELLGFEVRSKLFYAALLTKTTGIVAAAYDSQTIFWPPNGPAERKAKRGFRVCAQNNVKEYTPIRFIQIAFVLSLLPVRVVVL